MASRILTKFLLIFIFYLEIFFHLILYFNKKTEYRKLENLGGIAQLGERLNGIQEVRSSILLISTKISLKVLAVQGLSDFLYLPSFSISA